MGAEARHQTACGGGAGRTPWSIWTRERSQEPPYGCGGGRGGVSAPSPLEEAKLASLEPLGPRRDQPFLAPHLLSGFLLF